MRDRSLVMHRKTMGGLWVQRWVPGMCLGTGGEGREAGCVCWGEGGGAHRYTDWRVGTVDPPTMYLPLKVAVKRHTV